MYFLGESVRFPRCWKPPPSLMCSDVRLTQLGQGIILPSYIQRRSLELTMKPPKEVVQNARDAFNSGRTKSLEFRERQLKALLKMYTENRTAMMEALAKDLHKSKQEALVAEIEYLINDVRGLLVDFKEWTKPEKQPRGIVNLMDEVQIIKDPYGVVLIIGAWNYPLQLSLLPLAGAIAAGNCAIVKPSEVSTASEKFIDETLPKYLDNDCFHVICGGPDETTELLKERFDYIFYTGSTTVGRIIHKAANKYLTPVTLELGGKSPVYIDSTADIDITTRRLLWGKLLNLGQTCIAPDYVLCTKDVQDKLLIAAKKVNKEFYGDNSKSSPDLCRIVSDRHFNRLEKLLENADIAIGGKVCGPERFIEPTLLINVKPTDPIMQDEIFGPILPILNVKDTTEAINFIKAREKPLAFYIFSENKNTVDLLLSNVSAGGVCVNDTIMHIAVESLPFGGVGYSGMGAYHGKYTFDTFSHRKSTLIKNLGKLGEKIASSRYPPYSDAKIKFVVTALKRRDFPSFSNLRYIFIYGLGFATAYVSKMLCDKFRDK